MTAVSAAIAEGKFSKKFDELVSATGISKSCVAAICFFSFSFNCAFFPFESNPTFLSSLRILTTVIPSTLRLSSGRSSSGLLFSTCFFPFPFPFPFPFAAADVGTAARSTTLEDATLPG
jgi:hypothetical protein